MRVKGSGGVYPEVGFLCKKSGKTLRHAMRNEFKVEEYLGFKVNRLITHSSIH